MRVLIVDDSIIIRNRIVRLLSNEQIPAMIVVGMAKNGSDALAVFEQSRPDIVTMDLTMPVMDGVECTSRMVDLDPDVNILVISALSDKATAIAALKKGAKGFLYKPFTDQQLVDAFNELVS